MNYNNYDRMADKIRSHPFLFNLIKILNIIFTGVGFFMYPLLLFKLGAEGFWRELAITVMVPGLAFMAVTMFRKRYNAPRPYQVYPIHPLINKEKSGESFPSRHTYSILLIGGLWFLQSPAVGTAILLIGLALAAIRVIGGVHFIKDVVCAFVLAMATVLIVYFMYGKL